MGHQKSSPWQTFTIKGYGKILCPWVADYFLCLKIENTLFFLHPSGVPAKTLKYLIQKPITNKQNNYNFKWLKDHLLTLPSFLSFYHWKQNFGDIKILSINLINWYRKLVNKCNDSPLHQLSIETEFSYKNIFKFVCSFGANSFAVFFPVHPTSSSTHKSYNFLTP